MSELQKYIATEMAHPSDPRCFPTSQQLYLAHEVDAARAEDKQRITELEALLRKISPAARDILWCALVWNDHNHDQLDLLEKAKRAALSVGFERGTLGSAIPAVNEFMARIDAALLVATPPAREE